MVNDIIKNILFKLKGDSKDFDKNIGESFKNLKKKYDDTFNSPQAKKTLDTFAKNISKNNMDLSAGFSKYAGVVKRFNEAELATLERKAQRYSKFIDGLEVKIKNSKSEAEKEGYIKQQTKAFGRATAVAGKYNAIKSGTGDDDGNLMNVAARALGIPIGPAAIAAMAAAMAVKVTKDIINSPMSRLQTGANLTQLSEAMYSPGASGNLSRAYYLANNKDAISQSRKAAGVSNMPEGMSLFDKIEYERRNPQDTRQTFRKFKAAYNWVTNLGEEGSYSSKLKELEGTDTNQALDLKQSMDLKASKFLPYLQSKAGSRLAFQRSMNLSDTAFRAINAEANGEGLLEEEFTGTAGSLRGSFGQKNAQAMALAAGRIRSSLNMDLGTSSSMLGVMSGMGATVPESEARIATIMASAFSKGLKDYGLAENIARANIEVAAKTGNLGAAEYGAARSAQILEAMGNPTDARSQTAAGNVSNTISSIFGASPRNQTALMSNLFKSAGSLGISERNIPSFVSYVMQHPESLDSASTDEYLKTIITAPSDRANEVTRNITRNSLKDIVGNATNLQDVINASVKGGFNPKDAVALWNTIHPPALTPNSPMPQAADMTKTIPYALSTGTELDTSRQTDFGANVIDQKGVAAARGKSLEMLQAGTSVSAAGDQLVQAMGRFVEVMKAANGNSANSRGE
jgi:hypothetical protein